MRYLEAVLRERRWMLGPLSDGVRRRSCYAQAMSIEQDLPVTVFYLVTEPFRGGFRWLVKQYGAAHAVETGNEAFASETEARKSGRPALIRTSAHVPIGRRRLADVLLDRQSVG